MALRFETYYCVFSRLAFAPPPPRYLFIKISRVYFKSQHDDARLSVFPCTVVWVVLLRELTNLLGARGTDGIEKYAVGFFSRRIVMWKRRDRRRGGGRTNRENCSFPEARVHIFFSGSDCFTIISAPVQDSRRIAMSFQIDIVNNIVAFNRFVADVILN